MKIIITLLLLSLTIVSVSQRVISDRISQARGPFLFATTSVQEDDCIWQNFSAWNGVIIPESYTKECPSFAGYSVILTREGNTRKLGLKQEGQVIYFQDAIWETLDTEIPYTITDTVEWTYTFDYDTPFIKALIYKLQTTDFNYQGQRNQVGWAVVNLMQHPCLETVTHSLEDARNVANYLVDGCGK